MGRDEPVEETMMPRLRRFGAVALAAASLAAVPACGSEDVESGADKVQQEGKEAAGKAEDAAKDAAREAEDAARDATDGK
jgi:hypothetical protein